MYPYFYCSELAGVTMPGFGMFYLVWFQLVSDNFGGLGG